MDQVLLSMQGINKAFAGVPALQDVAFSVKRGEVHGLAGQNGAGKSTLIKILTGVYQKDSGAITLDGENIAPQSPRDARRYGVNSIYQELNLIPNLSVAENIFLGHEIRRRGIIDWKKTAQEAERILAELGLAVAVESLVSEQSVAVQQMIAIARAVSFEAKLIVMDEPTSSLEDSEVRVLMQLIRRLKARGISIVFITHRLDEMFEICDRITILRDGKLAGVYETAALDKLELILKMIGKDRETFSQIQSAKGESYARKNETILQLAGLRWKNRLSDVSFTMRRGEILGVAGLLGAGKTEIAKCIFGGYTDYTGVIAVCGQPMGAPRRAIAMGIGFVPEDRKTEGILPRMSVLENISIVLLPRIARFGLIDKKKELEIVKTFIEALGVKIASLDQEVRTLSGGNQQKVMLARWLCTDPTLLILDEPTRGIDVGAKLDVQRLIRNMARDGVSVLMINSELDELVRACERVLIMRDGRTAGMLEGDAVTENNIMNAIARAE